MGSWMNGVTALPPPFFLDHLVVHQAISNMCLLVTLQSWQPAELKIEMIFCMSFVDFLILFLFYFILFCQSLAVQPRLASYSCSFCPSLLNAEIVGLGHHSPLFLVFHSTGRVGRGIPK
jgi:hypothetical protein